MSSTNFIDQTTPIVASWLNDVNTATYTTVPANTTAIATETTNRTTADNTIVSNLAASTGSNLIGFAPTGAATTTIQNRLNRTACDLEASGAVDASKYSSQTCYGVVSVNVIRTVINRHAFEDTSILNTTDTGLGYASFDAYASMNNSLPQDHFHGYQSRNQYKGSNTLTAMYGYWSALEHIGSGTITRTIGLRIDDVAGSGTVGTSYGLFISAITRGSPYNYAIWSNGGENHFVGDIKFEGKCTPTVNGYFSYNTPQSVGTSTYTVLATDTYINVYGGACTITLPTASTCPGRKLVIKTTTANAVISASSNVYPLATNVLGTAILAATAGKWAELISDGTTWTIMSGN
jgi:hypothetical protein